MHTNVDQNLYGAIRKKRGRVPFFSPRSELKTGSGTVFFSDVERSIFDTRLRPVMAALHDRVLAGSKSNHHAPEAHLTMSALRILLMLLLIGGSTAHGDDAPLPPDESVPVNTTANDDANKNIVLPTEVGDHKLKFKTHIGQRAVEMSYLLHLPPDYGDVQKKHPMLVFFHGVGECGTDLAGVYALGPMTLLKQDGGNPVFAASCPFIVLCPQCPPRGQTWDTDYMYKAVAELVDQTIRKTRCDPDRVYATGLSMGGLGTWCVAEQAPNLFAAIAPLSAMAWHPEQVLDRLKYVSVWCVVGLQDQPRFLDGTRSMDAALSKGPLQQRFIYLVDNGHDAFWPSYQSPQFYEWLLAHHRPSVVERKKLDAQKLPPTTQPIPTAPGHYLLSYGIQIGNQPYQMDYVLYLPRGYKPNATPRPAMLFLHEQDTIGPDFNGICMHGPDLELERNASLKNDFPFVVISPRLPIKCDWETPGMTQALLSLIDHVSQSIKIDPKRISVSGINIGAIGAMKLAAEAPTRFSAVVPVMINGPLIPGDDRKQVVSATRGCVFIKGSEAASIAKFNELIAGSKLDWRIAKMPESASPLGDIGVYEDRAFLNWLQQLKSRAKVY
jgi:predicted peptidase